MHIRLQIGLEDHLRTRAGYNRVMKKYMVADLVKDLNKDKVMRAMEEYGLSKGDAEEFVDNYPNESAWPDVEGTAELYGVGIIDVDDDMVEAYLSFNEEEKVYLMELGGMPKAKGEISTSMGKVFFWFNISLGTFILTTIFDKGNIAQYPVSVSELRDIRSSSSFGEKFNKDIRSNTSYSDKPGACGCIGEDPANPKRLCDEADFAQMPKEFKRYL
jgi:hypothetical protein